MSLLDLVAAPARRPRIRPVPGPRAPAAAQTLQWLHWPTQMLERARARHGETFRLDIAPEPIVLLCGREDIRRVMAAGPDQVSAGEANLEVTRVTVGTRSTIGLDGHPHARRRKQLRPGLNGAQLRGYGTIMEEITREVVSAFPRDRTFALHPAMQEITLRVIARTVFGTAAGHESRELTRRLGRFLRLGELPLALLVVLHLSTHPEAERRAIFRALLASRERAREIVAEQIARRRAAGGADDDVLSLLLRARDEAGQPLSDDELQDELMTLLVAGHETTATALCWCFELILSHPRVRARLGEELDAAGGVDASPEVIQALPYLDATLKEVLRLRPVLAFVRRRLRQPFTLGGYALPNGTTVAPCIYLAQRDPRVYPDPERFEPERFLGAKADPCAWLPFGGGARRCVGIGFAQYEMKIVLARVLASQRLTLAARRPARTVHRAITFFPEGGTRVRATVEGHPRP